MKKKGDLQIAGHCGVFGANKIVYFSERNALLKFARRPVKT